ncbi:hypothetical protein PFISCL1PPCAC_17114, partial [Pristionchus fissidentatus]
ILAVLSILGALVSLANSFQTGKHTAGWCVASGIWSIASLVAAILVFHAISKTKPTFINPIIAITGVTAVVALVFMLAFLYAFFDPESWVGEAIKSAYHNDKSTGLTEDELFSLVTVGNSIGALLCVLFSVWSIAIYRDCRAYLKEQER